MPVVPGGHHAIAGPAGIAGGGAPRSGLPALLKAAGGGGGKGMRTVDRPRRKSPTAIESASGRSARAFGNGALYVERLIERARHIEIQIFGRSARPHRPRLRARLLAAAAPPESHRRGAGAASRAAPCGAAARGRACRRARSGYVNAGTIEFLVEGEGDAATFYFLEMNTRLQVEHPVTEAITGLDLVRAQIDIANGEPLPFTQDAIATDGPCDRVPRLRRGSRRLLPQSGRLLRYREPEGPGSGSTRASARARTSPCTTTR